MKIISLAMAGAVLVLAGCGQKQTNSTQATNAAPAKAQATNSASDSGNPLMAPVNYLGALDRAQQLAQKTARLSSLQEAIRMFQVQEGRFPRNLEELVQKQCMSRIPKAPYGMRYSYNPRTGQVALLRQ